MALSLITFVAGTKIKSSEVNSNFSTINAELFDIKNANIAASAAIVDTKLAQITTPGKVDGASIVVSSIEFVKGTVLWFIRTTVLTVADDVSSQFVVPATLSFDSVDLSVKTAPTGAALIIDIESKRGAGAFTTLFTTKPQIDASSLTGGGSAVFDTGTHGTEDQLIADDILRLNIDQVGSSVEGVDLTVTFRLKQKVPQV